MDQTRVRPTAIARLRAAAMVTTVALVLPGCIMVPQTVESYDSGCQQVSRRMELQPVQLGAFHNCAGSECSAMLVTFGAVAAASLVVSGSIAVVGNVAYWLEERGRCIGSTKPVQPSPP